MAAQLQAIFRTNIRREIRARGWSQRDLARTLKISDASVSELLNGVHAPTLSMVDRIAEALSVPAFTLVQPHSLQEISEIPS